MSGYAADMPELKPISVDAVPAALEKAERYRLLDEPIQAESICLDVIAVDPVNQLALVTLLLARTDQFANGMGGALQRARNVLPALESAYNRAYYAGIICERSAIARLQHGGHGAAAGVRDWVKDALEHYAEAERLRSPGNDDPILRWNACVRLLERYPAGDDAADSSAGLMMLE